MSCTARSSSSKRSASTKPLKNFYPSQPPIRRMSATMSSIEEDLVPQRLMKKVKAGENGRLEVTWRIYDALCNISQGDLSEVQQRMIRKACMAAYEDWKL